MKRREFTIGLAQCGAVLVCELCAVSGGQAQGTKSAKGKKPNTPSPAGRSTWTTYYSPDGDYSIQFPTRPQTNNDGNAGRSASYIADAHNHRFFIQAYLGDPSLTTWTKLEINKFVQNIKRQGGMDIRDLQLIAPHIIEFRSGNSAGENSQISQTSVSRMILREGVQYVLLVKPHPGARLNDVLAGKFLGSFKFTSRARVAPGDAESGVISCRRCNGTGKEFCIFCRGTGWTDSALRDVEGRYCKFCNGEGRHICNTCKGKGKVRI